jgi:hypothetical protein
MTAHRWSDDVCTDCSARRDWALARQSCPGGGRSYHAAYTAERRARDPEYAQRLRDWQRAYAKRKRASGGQS